MIMTWLRVECMYVVGHLRGITKYLKYLPPSTTILLTMRSIIILFLLSSSYASVDATISFGQTSTIRRTTTWSMIPRGGEGGRVENTNHTTQIIPLLPSKHSSALQLIDTKSVSLALRLTCETNRRLIHGSTGTLEKQQQYEEDLTVFHLDLHPDSSNIRTYLDKLLSAIGIEIQDNDGSSTSTNTQHPMEDEAQIILALTLLYLDQCASSDISPYVNPQTIHKLLLTAVSLSTKCIRGDNSVSKLLCEAANSILHTTITEAELDKMEHFLRHSISNEINMNEIELFMRKIAAMFYPQRLAAFDQLRMKHLEIFSTSFSGGSGGNTSNQHGHGNYLQTHEDFQNQNHPTNQHQQQFPEIIEQQPY